MNKFLKLVEETNPEVGYIVEIRGPDGALMGRAGIPGNNTSFYEELAMFLRDRGGDVVGAVEDQEEELSDEDHKTISNVNTAAERGNKEAQAAVSQAKLNTKRKFDKELQKHRELTS